MHEAWYENLKTFRDPATHRMPLSCPPITISNEKELEEYKNDLRKITNDDYKFFLEVMDIFFMWIKKQQGKHGQAELQ